MRFIGWMYDIAREQSPREDVLREMLTRSLAAGYNAVGLYLEHRFAYPSAPFAAGPGSLTADVVRRLRAEFQPRGLRIIPFLNTLGHMEGFIRAEGGQWLAEGPSGFGGAQICATRPACAKFAQNLVADILEVFDDEWVHLGGDETRQLGQCPRCAARAAEVGRGGLYAQYYAPLCRWVIEQGRRPCLWGDMLIEHPGALDSLPRQTLIFDWHYDRRPRESTRMFHQRGFDVVCCPAVHTFDASWCFLELTQGNIDEHAQDAESLGALGVLVTSWEMSYFTQYLNTLPIIYAAGRRLSRGEDWAAALTAAGGASYALAADIIGRQLPATASFLKPGTWRQLREHWVIRLDPFRLWRIWRNEACGQAGGEILRLCAAAERELEGNCPLHFAIELHRVAVLWVRAAEAAQQAYTRGDLDGCARQLEHGQSLHERLRPGLERARDAGGSVGDVARLERLIDKIKGAVQRVRALPAGPYRPAFETLTHDAYISGDQAAWTTATPAE